MIAFLTAYAVALKNQRLRIAYIKEHNLQNITLKPVLYYAIKRLCDICVALAVCVLVLPLFYVIFGILIKMSSKGPIIFRHKRKGLFEREFMCYKFRSMYEGASAERVLSENDCRITVIGRFLRKTHLDEFPQFFNVLKGDMSLVGPRPLSAKALEKYAISDKVYYRFVQTPGITGPAQINSGRDLSPEQYLQYDACYVSNPSLLGDFQLLLKTLKFADAAY